MNTLYTPATIRGLHQAFHPFKLPYSSNPSPAAAAFHPSLAHCPHALRPSQASITRLSRKASLRSFASLRHPSPAPAARLGPLPNPRPFNSCHVSRTPHTPSLSRLNMSTNGESRPKRRQSPVPQLLERPGKKLKQENGVPTPGDATPQNGSVYDVGLGEKDAAPKTTAIAPAGDSPEWQATIEKVIKSVVSIHFCQTCSFDTDSSTSSQASGFVVDAERGYILTNRHVVCSGPFWGYCVFDNHEEVSRTRTCLMDMSDVWLTINSAMSDPSTAILSTISASSNSIPRPSSTCKSPP
jgi:hypothetical protein